MFLASGNTGYNSVADVVVVLGLIFPFWLSCLKLQKLSLQAPERNKPVRNVSRYSVGCSSAAWRPSPQLPNRPLPVGWSCSPSCPSCILAEPAAQLPLVLVVVVSDPHYKLNSINSVVSVGSSPPAFLLLSHIAHSKEMRWISSLSGDGLALLKAGIFFSLMTAW